MAGDLNPNGPWTVTTEGDCEGRATRHLGSYAGPIDRIAFALATRAEYVLEFEPLIIVDSESLPVTATTAFIRVRGVKDARELLHGRPVAVSAGNYYESTKLVGSTFYDPLLAQSLAEQAMKKLSPQEFSALKTMMTTPNLGKEQG